MGDNNLPLLRQFRGCTGQIIALRPFDVVLKVETSKTKASILIATFSFDELVRSYRFKKHGAKLIGYYLSTQGWLQAGMPITVWDEDFVPFTQAKTGRSVSPHEYAARLHWERNVHRPGSDITPLDSYERVLAGYTTDAMERYW